MGNRRKILTSIAVATVFMSASPASAQTWNPAYATTFYSDASKTTQIGQLLWTGCDAYGSPTYRRLGSSSVHTENEHIGYCYGDEMHPV